MRDFYIQVILHEAEPLNNDRTRFKAWLETLDDQQLESWANNLTQP